MVPHMEEQGDDQTEAHDNSDGLVLKPRKTKQFKKKRKRIQSSITEDTTVETEVQANVLLLKEAQRLRDTSRRSGLPQGTKLRGKKKETDSAIGDVAGGLGKAFAVERSAHVEEERMTKYVNEKMREKFGDSEPEAPVIDVAKKFEDELYAIPDHLRGDTRTMYDPGEGLPASGVEEVELPESVRKRNEKATELAKKQLLSRRGTRSKDNRGEIEVGGNMSANFLQHRTQRTGNKVMESGKGDGEKREMATDAQALERWRKRWRK